MEIVAERGEIVAEDGGQILFRTMADPLEALLHWMASKPVFSTSLPTSGAVAIEYTKNGTTAPPWTEAIYAMNTSTRSAALILAASLGLSTVASATDESMSRQRASEARNTNQPASKQTTTGWRHTVEAPFRFAGRAGRTVLRSPLIVGETVTGERKFISRNGFMARANTDLKPEAAPAENSAVSINMGRGQRVPVMADE